MGVGDASRHDVERPGRARLPGAAPALGEDFKDKASIVVYLVAIPLAFANSWLAYSL